MAKAAANLSQRGPKKSIDAGKTEGRQPMMKVSGRAAASASPAPPWSVSYILGVLIHHPLLCLFGVSLLFFMGVEYTIGMIPSASPPFDIGFVLTRPLNTFLSTRPNLNTLLAALNTVFVGMQTSYIIWTLLIERRPRATISALFMFTCRGILGCSTQLPLPQGFLGSGADFPVGNVSFFLFFSGHVAGSVIASLDMRRMRRYQMAMGFDALNLLQALRLLATRGHYTIDLAVGVGAGLLFDALASNYEEASAKTKHAGSCCCNCDVFT
ncbi:hypothetical protein J5N97_013237 [Dioscorea zingiberensis]|uniref:AtPDCT1/2 transmembrane domain-containing protein n=1 Tax=Dioscorea zingiberensis TaxID=325984 RepID=A0A9D5HIL9_9LILI|nr:hypothetical protein J5N97_013237 [Dioscorea zingiberensis]